MLKFDEMKGSIWLNGKVLEWGEAKIHLMTHGLHYGSSVYEGVRVYNWKPYKIREHMDRLHNSAKCIGIEIPFTADELIEVANEQVRLNNIENGYIRPVAWRGTETMLIGGGSKIANIGVAAWAIFENRDDLRNRGMRVCFSKWRKPAPDASPYTAKTAGIYTVATIVKNEAIDLDCDDALMLDGNGNITEATTANFFAIINGELHTPIPDCFLDGITRQTIIEIAKKFGIKVHERKIRPEALDEAEAAFLTGTAIEIMPIQNIVPTANFKNWAVTFDIKNPLLLELMQKYAAEVAIGSFVR